MNTKILNESSTPMIDPTLISDNNTFKFKPVPGMGYGFTDVYYKGQRVAIINGRSSALQWVAKNGSNIPNKIIDKLENTVKRWVVQTYKMNKKEMNEMVTKILNENQNIGDIVTFEIPYYGAKFKFSGKIINIDNNIATIEYQTAVSGKLKTLTTDVPLNKLK
jgi:hypothetical protein